MSNLRSRPLYTARRIFWPLIWAMESSSIIAPVSSRALASQLRRLRRNAKLTPEGRPSRSRPMTGFNALGDDVELTTQYMHVYLAQYGTYVASFLHPFSTLFNWGFANNGAALAWALQLPPQQPPPEGSGHPRQRLAHRAEAGAGFLLPLPVHTAGADRRAYFWVQVFI
jgi:hypothetical protein